MAHKLRQWPNTVYPGELGEFPEAQVDIDVALLEMSKQGPAPAGYKVKNLGKSKGGLWQLNMKVEGRQIRILYAPYGDVIFVFRIHKKSSDQEQQRAYDLAMKRKREVDRLIQQGAGKDHVGLTIH